MCKTSVCLRKGIYGKTAAKGQRQVFPVRLGRFFSGMLDYYKTAWLSERPRLRNPLNTDATYRFYAVFSPLFCSGEREARLQLLFFTVFKKAAKKTEATESAAHSG